MNIPPKKASWFCRSCYYTCANRDCRMTCDQQYEVDRKKADEKK